MKKFDFAVNSSKNIYGRINIIDEEESAFLIREITDVLRSNSKVELQRKEHKIISLDFFEKVERFMICKEVDITAEYSILGLFSKKAKIISSCLSMLGKKNKTELDYIDILNQKDVLLSELNNEHKWSDEIFELRKKTIPVLDSIAFLSLTMLTLILREGLPVKGFLPTGEIKTYLRPLRDPFGNILTDPYKNLLMGIENDILSNQNFNKVKGYIHTRLKEMIEKYGLLEFDEEEAIILQLINAYLECNTGKCEIDTSSFIGEYSYYDCGVSYYAK